MEDTRTHNCNATLGLGRSVLPKDVVTQIASIASNIALREMVKHHELWRSVMRELCEAVGMLDQCVYCGEFVDCDDICEGCRFFGDNGHCNTCCEYRRSEPFAYVGNMD